MLSIPLERDRFVTFSGGKKAGLHECSDNNGGIVFTAQSFRDHRGWLRQRRRALAGATSPAPHAPLRGE